MKTQRARLLIFLTAIAVVALASLQLAQAQDRWNIELRGAAAMPTEKFGDTDLDIGGGIEGMISYRFMPHLAAYAGWGWNRFSADQSFAGSNVDFEETGYTYGLQFIHPIGQSDISYLLRAGGLANHIEVEDSGGDVISDSGHGFGWQVEAGLAIPLGEKWRVLPSVRYHSLERDIKIGTVNTPVDLNYISLGVGISWSF